MFKITGSSLSVIAMPRVAAFRRSGRAEIEFYCASPLYAIGSVALAPDAQGASPGWSVGFLQAQVTETNYAIYRGIDAASGSVFEDRIDGTLRTVPCFDAAASGTPFIRGERDQLSIGMVKGFVSSTASVPPSSATAGTTLRVGHRDEPSVPYITLRRNPTTGQPNFINEVCIDFGFVTVLAVREPSGRFHYLRGFTWSIGWHQKIVVTRTGVASVPVPGGDRSVLGPMFEGAPTNAAALKIFEGARADTCNALANRAQNAPQLREVNGWPSYTPLP